MNEYINKQYIRNTVQTYLDTSCGAEYYAYDRVLDEIDRAPLTEIKQGEWTEEKYDHWSYSWGRVGSHSYTYKCSECSKSFSLPHNYCPDCGSKNKLKSKGGYNLGW